MIFCQKPAIQDGEVLLVESIAIMEYLMARYERRRWRRPACLM
jgi:glutathione S-transferase